MVYTLFYVYSTAHVLMHGWIHVRSGHTVCMVCAVHLFILQCVVYYTDLDAIQTSLDDHLLASESGNYILYTNACVLKCACACTYVYLCVYTSVHCAYMCICVFACACIECRYSTLRL